MLTKEQVKHVAKLARMKLDDAEIEKFTKQLDKVFGYMDVLNEVDTENVPETSQVTGLLNVLEEDEILPAQSNREELLSSSELPVDSKQVRVIKTIK
jgi:aspartyl-tRNA(Asn)/glutamyl-tRNA(Gln) amidotransferase subunit C